MKGPHAQPSDCPLMQPQTQKGVCPRCGTSPLPKGRRIWCSDECAQWYWENHRYTTARLVAMRAYRVYALATWIPKREIAGGPPPFMRQERAAYQAEMDGPAGDELVLQTGAFLGYVCVDHEGIVPDVEMDHIDPAEGLHTKLSCVHHQDNLRPKCRVCHQRRTREQAQQRAADRRGLTLDQYQQNTPEARRAARAEQQPRLIRGEDE